MYLFHLQIANFGMSSHLNEKNYALNKDKVSIRWTAPEVIS